ncbi:MAG TPA: energy transducer TonB [Bacteroidales bacterium]|nr:energy transducer TonB [Bacteroidales bacterium]HQK36102.1 energy transducer TonB [Bacteroidales bacterium]
MEVKKSDKANLEKQKGIFFQLGLVITLGLMLVAFEWTTKPSNAKSVYQVEQQAVEQDIIPVTRQEQQPVEQPPPPKVTEVLNIVNDDVNIDDELKIEDSDVDQNASFQIKDYVDQPEEEAAEEEVFFIVEEMPSFQGKGQEGFREWIQKNLQYPPVAAENGIQGRVFVQFAVNSKGEVVDAKVVKGVDPALDKEALRVVMSSPKWTPGKQRGKPVKVQFTFPIVFVLQ